MEAAAQKGYATATDLADYLVRRGCLSATRTKPMAYAVKAAAAHACDLSDCRWPCWQQFHLAIEKDVHDVLSLRGGPERPRHPGRHGAERRCGGRSSGTANAWPWRVAAAPRRPQCLRRPALRRTLGKPDLCSMVRGSRGWRADHASPAPPVFSRFHYRSVAMQPTQIPVEVFTPTP